MSSNVLKNVNDCYNFTEDNTSDKTKGKQRQRLRTYTLNSKSGKNVSSKSSEGITKTINKENESKDHKWRCDSFKEIIKSAIWLNDIRADNRLAIDSVLEGLTKHLSDDCNCVNICSTHLLVGNTYFERFLFNRKEFENKIISEENKIESNKCNESKTKNSIINDIPNQKESKLESTTFPELVTLNNMSSLLSPLEEAVNHWNQAFQLNQKLGILTEEAIIGFKIYYNLSSVFQIYCLYNQMECRLRVAELLNSFCQYFGSKYSEISLTANYYLVKTYLELGAVTKASQILTRNSSSTVSFEQKLPETFGKSLNLLAKLEIELINGRSKKAAKHLKDFIGSDYLQKLTVNRYYVKGMSLLLATKFIAKDFDYSQYFQEFLEPIQMSLSILKRWNPWLSTSPKSENQMINSGDLDPLWYKFAVLNYSFDAMQMSAQFYANIEMPIDSIFYYNALIKLGRRYCAVIRLSKLLVMGSHLDVICDHRSAAQTKLNYASLCLQSKSYSLDSDSVFNSNSSVSTISPDTKKAMNGQLGKHMLKNDPEVEVFEINPNTNECIEVEECQHIKEANVSTFRDLKQKFMKRTFNLNSNGFYDSDDSIQELDKNMFLTLNVDSNKGVIELFFAKFEVDFHKLLVNETDPNYVLRQINDIHKNCLESYVTNILKKQFQELIPSYRLEELYKNCDYYKSLKFKTLETIARIQIQIKDFKGAVNTCNELNGLNALTYEQRANYSNLLYSDAFSKFQLFKDKFQPINKVWIEYNSLFDEITTDSSNFKSLTPTPQKIKSKALVPNAPKHNRYINEESEGYVTALTNKMFEETDTNVSKNTNSFKYKTYPKLNLENETQLRSLSNDESNLASNETNFKDITSQVLPRNTSKSNLKTISGRMTRSRTSSLKTSDKSIDLIEPKVLKSFKMSSLSSIKSEKKSQVLDLEPELDQEIEELDDVFEKMSITEKLTQNVSNDITLESIIAIFKRIFDLMSSHPISRVYTSIHKLLAEIYSISNEINEELIGYHFSESVRSTYRYRKLFIAEKKRRLNRLSNYDLNSVFFHNTNIDTNNSCQHFVDNLPNVWRVLQMMEVNNESQIPDLMICRYQRDKKPIFLRIKSDPQKIIKYFMTNFVEIIERSNASIVNKDRETFWRLRYSLDNELMILLRSVEDICFGPFKGILFGEIQSQSYHKMCRRLKAYILELTTNETLVCLNEPLLEVMIESLPFLKRSEFDIGMKVLFKTPSTDLLTKCFSKYEEMFCNTFPIDNKESIFMTYRLSPVGLILDKSLESFPFECLPSLHAINQSIFRTPSLRILSLMYNTFKDGISSKGIDDSKVYYILNPSDNLAKTEDYFKHSFQSMKEWKGVIGKSPNPSQLKEAFESEDAYIFFGHGAGATYYRTIPDGIDGCTLNCASVVIGCSSGKLFSDGKQLESYGTPYRFLMNGCPSYVGVLWDVTDKDIDKFSDYFLSYWFSKWKPELNDKKKVMPNTKAVSLSRQRCRLKYLIGAAPVVYGLPLSTKTFISD